MKLYGKEIDFKISRLKDAARFEQALKHMEETEEALKKEKKLSSILGRLVQMFADFFREATGEDVLAGVRRRG